jgi:hypothetical protein
MATQVPPPDFPSDPDARVNHAIAAILAEEVAALRPGDGQQLRELADFIIRAVYNGSPPQPPAQFSVGACKKCSRCRQELATCTLPPAECVRRFQECMNCPCQPG